MANTTTTFLDNVLVLHKTLRDQLKSIWGDILKDFVQMLDQMLAKALMTSSLLERILGFGGGLNLSMLGPASVGNPSGAGYVPSAQQSGSPLGPNAVASATSGASSYGILGALLGSSGAAQVIAALGGGADSLGGTRSSLGGGGSITINVPNAKSVANAAAGAAGVAATGAGSGTKGGAASTLGGASGAGVGGAALASAFTGGGGSGGGAGLSSTFGGNASDAVYGGGYGGASAVPAAGGGAGSTLLSRFNIGGVSLGNMLLGAMAGGLIANMLDHGNQDASIGGMVGGAGGTLLGSMLGKLLFTGGAAAGPAGMIIGSVIGALLGTVLGGLFGDHFSQGSEPDIYNTQAWGQELADMQGSTAGNPMIANGQDFVMDSSTSSQTQGLGWNVLIEKFVAKFRQNQKALPTELQAGFPMLEELWGGAQDSPDFNGNGKNGMLQIGSGTMASWETFWSYVSAYGPAISQLMAMYTPTDLYAASLNGSVSEIGGYTPTGEPWLLHSFPDAGLPAGASSQAPAMLSAPGGSKQTVTNVNVYQSFGGSLIAENAMNTRIYKAISAIPGFSQMDLSGT